MLRQAVVEGQPAVVRLGQFLHSNEPYATVSGGSPLLGVQSGVQQQRGLKVSKKKRLSGEFWEFSFSF